MVVGDDHEAAFRNRRSITNIARSVSSDAGPSTGGAGKSSMTSPSTGQPPAKKSRMNTLWTPTQEQLHPELLRFHEASNARSKPLCETPEGIDNVPTSFLKSNLCGQQSLHEQVALPHTSQSSRQTKAEAISSDIIETDTESSDEATKFEDDSEESSEDSDEPTCVMTALRIDNDVLQNIFKSALENFKQKLLHSTAKEFWASFEDTWQREIQKYGNESTSSVSTSSPDSSNQQNTTSSFGDLKHHRDNEDENSEEGKEENGRKRVRQDPNSSSTNEDVLKFACPYRKHNPAKYCIGNGRRWRSCALTPLYPVSRVKGHLYRHHRIYQCRRCKIAFDNQEELSAHAETLAACEPKAGYPIDGITDEIEKRLRSRKKTHPREEDRWKEIFQILFPGAEVPSPYFEPLPEDTGRSANQRDATSFADYLRRELPRVFSTALETAINNRTQPIADQLRCEAMDIFQECQEQVLNSYRQILDSWESSHALAQPLIVPDLNVSSEVPKYAQNTALQDKSSNSPIQMADVSLAYDQGHHLPSNPQQTPFGASSGFHNVDLLSNSLVYSSSLTDTLASPHGESSFEPWYEPQDSLDRDFAMLLGNTDNSIPLLDFEGLL